MAKTDWKPLSRHCIQHRETGHNVVRVIISGRETFEVWRRRGKEYRIPGDEDRFTDSDSAKEAAARP